VAAAITNAEYENKYGTGICSTHGICSTQGTEENNLELMCSVEIWVGEQLKSVVHQ
jgi:hypothetical protein